MIKKTDIESIAKAAEEDEGMKLPGLRESLAEMINGESARVFTPEQILVRSAREKLGLSQNKFAELIKTPVGTVRDWEQGRFLPPGGIQCLLLIAIKHPDIVKELAA
ncbi:MAG: helix-turn-helix domain-containing protein [Nitrosomonas sp.]|nr:helix-turn-helix domain-containing protein [Nitrosomonas sp.]